MSGAKTDEEVVLEIYMNLYLKSLTIGVGHTLENGIEITERFLSLLNNRLQHLLKRIYAVFLIFVGIISFKY